jgi:hypothetical protein
MKRFAESGEALRTGASFTALRELCELGRFRGLGNNHHEKLGEVLLVGSTSRGAFEFVFAREI